jgi:hypothetical protein
LDKSIPKEDVMKSRESLGLPPLEKKSGGGGLLAKFSALLKRKPSDAVGESGNFSVKTVSTTNLHGKKAEENQSKGVYLSFNVKAC